MNYNPPRFVSTVQLHYKTRQSEGRPRPPRHQVGWDIVRRECACQISWWSVEKWRRYYILKFHGNTFRWPTTLTFDLKFCENTDKQKHGQTHTQTNRHGHYNTSPSPYGGRGNNNFGDIMVLVWSQSPPQPPHAKTCVSRNCDTNAHIN